MKLTLFKQFILLGLLLFSCLHGEASPINTNTTTLEITSLPTGGPITEANKAKKLESKSNSISKYTAANETPPVILFTLSNDGSSDVGELVTATIKAYAPEGGRITLRIDSTEAYGNNSAANLAGATFSSPLPQEASDTATVTMSWVPKREQLGFIAFHFSAVDEWGNLTSDQLIYLVDMLLVIQPTPTIELAANQAFELIIPVEDGDWHELYEAEAGAGMPAWLSVEVIALEETASYNAIRLWGTPGPADRREYKFDVLVRAIFGKQASTSIHLRVVNGRNQGWFKDADGDGYGNNRSTLMACRQVQGYARTGGDCNDNDATVHPGATELADGQDNNCDGNADEGGSCNATNVVSFRQGFRPDGKVIGTKRSTPQQALGAPQENKNYNFVSLGFGGELVLELGSLVYDDGSTAADLMVVETTWGWANRPCYSGKGAGTPETMVMEVSANGSDWVAIPDTFCRNAKVDVSSVVGGKGKLPYVRYIKITDTSNPADFHPSSNGYDVDGVITCPALFETLQANARTATAGAFNPEFFNEVAEEEEELQQLSYHPNPVLNALSIETGVAKSERYTLELYNLQGALIYKGNHESDAATGKIELNLQHLNQGVYLLRMQGEAQQKYTMKIVKE